MQKQSSSFGAPVRKTCSRTRRRKMKRTSTKVWRRCSRISLPARPNIEPYCTQIRARSAVLQISRGGVMRVKDTAGHRLLWLPIALVLAITMFTARTQAQIVGDLEADIPFQFHAGNAKFPPGQYMI